MTAEIAIMNRSAVALAADSAVTITGKENLKIYNTVNKLFALSKYHPVGIMIYGSADLMGIPWESIIKIYRNYLSEKSFPTLEDYSKDLMNFLDDGNLLFPEAIQDEYLKKIIIQYFNRIKNTINKKVKDLTEQKGRVKKDEIKKITEDTINNDAKVWEKTEALSHLPTDYANKIIEKHEDFIKTSILDVFQKLPINSKNVKNLKFICGNIFYRNRFPENHAGIVIAGFGDEDTFPNLNSFRIEAVINKRLKYYKEESPKIDFDNVATIIPFAQGQNVATFVEGIDPSCKQIILSYLTELFINYPVNIVDSIKFNSEEEKKVLLNKLKDISKEILKDFKSNLDDYVFKKNISPIIDAVAFLPKNELASMAESLVNLTSFKQKISMDSETVGGPIDVAVISKGDGFVWIKRKQYFQPELNPHHLTKYFYTKEKDIKDAKKNK